MTTVTVKFALAQPAALLPLETAAIDGILTPRQNFKLHPSLKYEQPCIYSVLYTKDNTVCTYAIGSFFENPSLVASHLVKTSSFT